MSTDLNSLKTLAEFQQELLARLTAAHVALSQPNQEQRRAALQALRDFSGYTALPNDHLREVAKDAITDFLTQNINEALAGLRTLERELQEATQQAPLTMRLASESFNPKHHLLKALSSLTSLQAHQHQPSIAAQRQLPVNSDKLDQVVKLVEELLIHPQTTQPADAKLPKPSGRHKKPTKFSPNP